MAAAHVEIVVPPKSDDSHGDQSATAASGGDADPPPKKAAARARLPAGTGPDRVSQRTEREKRATSRGRRTRGVGDRGSAIEREEALLEELHKAHESQLEDTATVFVTLNSMTSGEQTLPDDASVQSMHVLQELLESEQTYRADLRHAVETLDNVVELIDAEHDYATVKAFVYNLRHIVALHEHLSERLPTSATVPDSSRSSTSSEKAHAVCGDIAEVFINLVLDCGDDLCEAYATHSANYLGVLNALDGAQGHSTAMKTVLRERQTLALSSGDRPPPPLKAIFYRPIKRVMDYNMFFLRWLKCTPVGSSQHHMLDEAMKATQWVAEHTNNLMGEILNAKEALLNKARVLTSELKGALPLEQLFRSSNTFVKDIDVDLRLAPRDHQAHHEHLPTSGTDRGSLGNTYVAEQAVLQLERQWGKDMSEFRLFLFNEALLLAQAPKPAGCCGRIGDMRYDFRALWTLGEVQLELLTDAERDASRKPRGTIRERRQTRRETILRGAAPHARLSHRGVVLDVWAGSRTQMEVFVAMVEGLRGVGIGGDLIHHHGDHGGADGRPSSSGRHNGGSVAGGSFNARKHRTPGFLRGSMSGRASASGRYSYARGSYATARGSSLRPSERRAQRSGDDIGGSVVVAPGHPLDSKTGAAAVHALTTELAALEAQLAEAQVDRGTSGKQSNEGVFGRLRGSITASDKPEAEEDGALDGYESGESITDGAGRRHSVHI